MDGLKDVAMATAAAAIPIVGVGGRCKRIFCSFIRYFLGSHDAPLAFRTLPHAGKKRCMRQYNEGSQGTKND